jgi:hypothetical protein
MRTVSGQCRCGKPSQKVCFYGDESTMVGGGHAIVEVCEHCMAPMVHPADPHASYSHDQYVYDVVTDSGMYAVAAQDFEDALGDANLTDEFADGGFVRITCRATGASERYSAPW